MNKINQLINDSTDNIWETLQWARENFINADYHTANYFLNNNYNLFVTLFDNGFDIKLEEYDDKDCINPEFDYQDSLETNKENLKECIESIILRNKDNITT